MKFRPCIDIHNGKVKQIVGGSLKDDGDQASENFVSEQDAAYYARLYRKHGLDGGHIILLNPNTSEYYPDTRSQALSALRAWPGGLQIGGGITADNARGFLDAGASHVIVTSYVFQNGQISTENLNRLVRAVGRDRLVLDLSCRKKDGRYYIVTDRWQTFTGVAIDLPVLEKLSSHCDEFLIHAVDVEGQGLRHRNRTCKTVSPPGGFPRHICGRRGKLSGSYPVKECRLQSPGCHYRERPGSLRR